MTKRRTLKQRLNRKVHRDRKNVFVSADFRHLGGYDQVLRALRELVQEGVLVKCGYGIYAKHTATKNVGNVTVEALNRLGVRWHWEGRNEIAFNGNTIVVRDRFNRDIRINGKSVLRQFQTSGNSLQHSREGRTRAIDFILGTINAPRPEPIDSAALRKCIKHSRVPARWAPHLTALFEEVSVDALHDAVICGFTNFEDLYRTSRSIPVLKGKQVEWVKEMADLDLARAA